MQTMDINSVLAQIRSMQGQAAGGSGAAAPVANPQNAISDFSEVLKNSIDKVNENQQVAGQMTAAFSRGEPGTELSEVMLAMNRSSVSFKAMAEVRNRLVSSYQEIMQMPV